MMNDIDRQYIMLSLESCGFIFICLIFSKEVVVAMCLKTSVC